MRLPQKKGKGKLPLFCGNEEQFIPVYGGMKGNSTRDTLSYNSVVTRFLLCRYSLDLI